jgi:hypothetical protein
MVRPLTAGLLHRPGNPGTKGKLLAKSLEAYTLGLETINRVTMTYRIENFCTLVCNAWELLLKAKILDATGNREDIYYKAHAGEKRRSLCYRTVWERCSSTSATAPAGTSSVSRSSATPPSICS